MSEIIQRIRERKYPNDLVWNLRNYRLIAVASLIMILVPYFSATPEHLHAAIIGVWTSTIFYVIFMRQNDFRLHKELIAEIDDLRREVNELKSRSE